MKLSLAPKLLEKLVWVPVILFCKIFIPGYMFDALLCRNWQLSPPKGVTLWITLLLVSLSHLYGMKIKNYGINYIEENLVNMIFSAQDFLPPDQKIQIFT
jgi:hypothetical protein